MDTLRWDNRQPLCPEENVKGLSWRSSSATKGDIYILDEPTTGLHMADVNRLIKVMDKLVDAGNSVYVIEHNMEVIASSDWIIDLGPRGGKNGGRLIFSGPPAQLLECQASYTAEFLRKSCLE